jgi:signal transduction histidine kinase/DNA-binding response OmpR family regulator/ligand-binding sensor domain-containing protein
MTKALFTSIPLFVLYLLGHGLHATAQNPPDHETISTAQGLSQGMIFDILQDKEGFIWVGTKEGLNRYDGYSFKVFTNDPYNPHSISNNNIRTLFEDSKGRIWAGTLEGGINVYDKKTGYFRRIMHKPGEPGGLSGNRIRSCIIEMADGRILVLPENCPLNIISLPDDFFENDTPPRITEVNLPDTSRAFRIGKDDKGKIWIGCADRKIYLYDAVNNAFDLLSDGKTFTAALAKTGSKMWSNRDVLLLDSSVVFRPFDTTAQLVPGAFTRNAAGKITIANYGEIPKSSAQSFYYEIFNWKQGMPFGQARAVSFNSSVINLQSVMIDRSGIIWAGTNGFGLNKYNIAAGRFHHLLPDFSVRSILQVGAGKLYLGGWVKDRWVFTDGSLMKNPIPGIFATHQSMNFTVSKAGEYWVWRDSISVLLRYDRTGKKVAEYAIDIKGTDEKQPLFEDHSGNIWICGLSGSLVRMTPATGKISTFSLSKDGGTTMLSRALSTAFYEDGQGTFWMGTEDGFVKIVFNDKFGEPSTQWYKNSVTDANSLNYNYVSCFLDDPTDNNYLWISTKGGGLNRLEKSTGKFLHLTTKDGLPNDVVYGILADGSGNIWGSTNRGIFCLLADKKKVDKEWVFRNFTKSDGLQGEEFNTGAYTKLPDGQLVFGGVNGLNIFNPSEVLAAGFQPLVYITNILIGNQPVERGDKTDVLKQTIETTKAITLTHLQDILSLEFSSLDFTAPERNKYRYQLEGIDKDWIESGTRRSATYLHLPAGDYVFKVQGSNSQGIWSGNIAELKISVLPPWWRTWWAYGCYVLLLGFLVRAYFKFTVNRASLQSQLNFEQLEAKRVKELDTVKTQLYTNITHEFRTPLTIILGMAQQVLNKPEEHFKNGMEMILRNGQNLLNLVNEMLDLSKLETGKMQLQLVNGDVVNYLRYIVESFHSLAESQRKQIHFLVEMDALFISYDPEKIRQIVTNLLSNALKFTPEKGNIYISVSEHVSQQDDHLPTLVIKVKDTGIGIPDGQLQHIFERFYQLDNSHTRKTEGTGIGLALTKELVKLMGGEITVKSPPTGANKGSEFTVVLPVKKPAIAKEATNYAEAKEVYPQRILANNLLEVAEEKQSSEKPLILLVEDNADVVAYTASCLPDYRLAVGNDGREGFEIAAELIPDLIITDVMMPFVDGFELCRQLRNDEHTSHIPIIMLTAKADMESRIEGLQQGADVYLEKPFHREELLVRIKKLLELRKSLQQHYLKVAGLNNSAAPAPVTMEAITINAPTVNTAAQPETINEKKEDAFVKKVREAVEAHVAEANFTIDQLCKLVFMSHSQLHRKLDALTGCSPNKFIRIIRLNKARELLKDPANSIASIAADCGYNDPGYFARIFKQEHGSTPQEWRMNGLKKV